MLGYLVAVDSSDSVCSAAWTHPRRASWSGVPDPGRPAARPPAGRTLRRSAFVFFVFFLGGGACVLKHFVGYSRFKRWMKCYKSWSHIISFNLLMLLTFELYSPRVLCLDVLAFTNFETQNRYQIKNSLGQQVYFAGEGTSWTCWLHFLVVTHPIRWSTTFDEFSSIF